MNGKAVARVGADEAVPGEEGGGFAEVVGGEAGAVAPPPPALAVPVLAATPRAVVGGFGADELMMATAGLPLPVGMTNSAGSRLVAPPTGIMATARCVPGVSCAWSGTAPGRATD